MPESNNNNENQQDTNMKTENRKRNVVRLTESQLKQIIAESVKRLLKESSNEFEFGKSVNFWKGLPVYKQDIFLNGSKVGYLITYEERLPKEVYYIIDADFIPVYTKSIEYELDYKKFTNYDEALKYAIDNFDAITSIQFEDICWG